MGIYIGTAANDVIIPGLVSGGTADPPGSSPGADPDTLDGGAGADTMDGGDGDDTYFVDDVGDVVAEQYNDLTGGLDVVLASASHTLGFGLENLTLQGFADINATGNENANVLTGNSSSNTLDGGAGSDELSGGSGADLLKGKNGGDNLKGGKGVDALEGGKGVDALEGGKGADVLTGGAGADDFVFKATAESGLGNLRDVVKDFTKGQDDLVLSAIDANATVSGNQAFKLDAGGAFSAGEIRQTQKGANLLIELNTDGDKAAEMSMLLSNVTGPLSTNDFLL